MQKNKDFMYALAHYGKLKKTLTRPEENAYTYRRNTAKNGAQ